MKSLIKANNIANVFFTIKTLNWQTFSCYFGGKSGPKIKLTTTGSALRKLANKS